ncbi:MAG: pyruvate:ferredoxin (flavodoxin) oxidoreductase, partial [Gammaproteobacteria bacterium]|nr:pyruvate:ferredoxin (flavodoxin) oxidoreductase [Gammaproteobacteria bacterium]
MTMQQTTVTLDGNEATAYVAYRVNEVCAIYPITPSSPMADLADEWSAKGIPNLWGNIPEVVEMQSEGGAAGTVHGALQTGALSTTFTASQGLMLMLPNMYKIAGELTSTVFQVAARSLATQALSIFGDHSDVMAARTTGFAMLASASVQEAHDNALISQAVTLEARVPFMHFFDGFRTSHEVAKITLLSDAQIRAMIDDGLVHAHRQRGLNPDNPFVRGTAQNPDIYFQARETVNPYYDRTPAILQETMDRFAELTGRRYRLFDYDGAGDAERLIVIMGSGAETVRETSAALVERGEKVGVIQVRLYRPFSAAHLLSVLPATTKSVAVLDRTKEPGAVGEPLYQDVVAALVEALSQAQIAELPRIVGGRYGLSSKEFTPPMVKRIFDELKQNQPRNHFTVGIYDDVSHTSLECDPDYALDESDLTQALFFGLGADGTVGANKNSIKIIGENTDLHAQGYFVYDSKKSGARTVSHLRFGPNPIRKPYLIGQADFVACHQFSFANKVEMLSHAKPGATFLLNSPHNSGTVWEHLPRPVQQTIIDKNLRLFVIDASGVAQEAGMGSRINTVMQTCFFALSGVLSRDDAISRIKQAIENTYSRKGPAVIKKNFKAVDSALAHLYEVSIPHEATSERELHQVVPSTAPEFVRRVTVQMMRGRGDELPVSVLPVDGTYPTGTAKWEKRDIADSVPIWEPDLCIQCGNCSFVCPHSVIRAKFYHKGHLASAPESFQSARINARGFPETRYTLQVYAADCTGCQLCVEACPVIDIRDRKTRAINMHPKASLVDDDGQNLAFFEALPSNDRTQVDFSRVQGAQFLEPLFEFSGACAGCGETPYVRLLSQLFGDRLIVANATGCSSIYGGNLPTTPWTTNDQGRGPAWSNSLFEDNAEFGLGMRIAVDKHTAVAHDLLRQLRAELNDDLVQELIDAPQRYESEIAAQRERVAILKAKLSKQDTPASKSLLSVADHLVNRSIWLVGGDGWAYDIGSAG